MARNTRPTPYDEQAIGAFDEAAGGAEFMAYGSTPSTATESYPLLPEDPMPLFLSDAAERPRAWGFGTGTEKNRTSAVVWPRIFKAGIFAASAAAIAFAFLSVDNPLALFANARASLIGSSADQSGATPKSDPQPAGPLQLASNAPPLPMPSTAGDKASAPAARVTPSRDDIALALRAAHQSQMESVQSPAAAPPARKLDADELAALLKRAKGLIAIGDIAPARLLLERAADAQEAGAALLLAQTYDPAVLGTPDMRSITPDPAAAREWYQKAARLGSPDAKQRLAQMQN